MENPITTKTPKKDKIVQILESHIPTSNNSVSVLLGSNNKDTSLIL